MFTSELATTDERVRLVSPDVERDAPLSVQWLAGAAGRETLRLMGETSANNHESNLETERERIASFLDQNEELNWMIQFEDRVVGAIWVHLKSDDHMHAPAISLMIGDPTVRGQGVGRSALSAVINWLHQERHEPVIYARHLTHNDASMNLLKAFGFTNEGEPYTDADGLNWQNVQLSM